MLQNQGQFGDDIFSRTTQTKDATVNQGNILHSGLTFAYWTASKIGMLCKQSIFSAD